ncbi:hypothetical protein HDU86_005565 [Geranomyces michiganensis]|nr:hypothetical protein HDU86_005565 [Geranomyces michiganensis]
MSDVQFDIKGYEEMEASYTSRGDMAVQAEVQKSRASVDQPGVAIKLDPNEIVSGSLSGSSPTYNPGPIFYEKACPAQHALEFTLRVPQGHFLSTTLRRPERYTPRLELITSPLLLTSFRGAMDLASQNVADQVDTFKYTPATSGGGFDFYTMNLTLNRPVLGHRDGDTVKDLVSKLILDASFVCGSTGSYMDEKMPSTTTFMVWNVQGNSPDAELSKSNYLNTLASSYDFGVYIETGSTVTRALKDVSVSAVFKFAVTLSNQNYQLDQKTLDDAFTKKLEALLVPIEAGQKNRIAKNVDFKQKAPVPTLIQNADRDVLAIIPVHWKASATGAQQKLEATRLLYTLEEVRTKYGAPIVVAGDFNNEQPLFLGKENDKAREKWKQELTRHIRKFPTIDRPTKMSFTARLPILESNELFYLRADLVSFNLRWFKWLTDNPFNEPSIGRRRDLVLKKYLEEFDVVALQEVSVTEQAQNKLSEDAENAYADKPSKDDYLPEALPGDDEKDADEMAYTTVGPQLHNEQLVLFDLADRERADGLSPKANGVFTKSTYESVKCFNKKIYRNEIGSPDLRICLVIRVNEAKLRGFWAGSVHERAGKSTIAKLVESKNILVAGSTRVDITKACDELYPPVSDGRGTVRDETGRSVKRTKYETESEDHKACVAFPLLIAGDWNPTADTGVLLTSPDYTKRSKQAESMAANVNTALKLDCTQRELILPGVDDALDSGYPNNKCNPFGTGSSNRPEWVTSKVSYLDFAFYCGWIPAVTARQNVLPVFDRARVDQWMVGLEVNNKRVSNKDEDDCNDDSDHPYAGPYEGAMDYLSHLPSEVLAHVALRIDRGRDLFQFKNTCRRLRSAISLADVLEQRIKSDAATLPKANIEQTIRELVGMELDGRENLGAGLVRHMWDRG